jgi:hypothetical protein
MDHFQGVVTEYLRADRSTFVNTECLINLDQDCVFAKSRHWYCDALAVNFRERTVYLCEVTYSQTMQSLIGRLRAWAQHWAELCEAIQRDCAMDGEWTFQPWVFIPEKSHTGLIEKLSIPSASSMPAPKVTYLEEVTPWKYSTWDRRQTAFAELQNTLDNAEISLEEATEVLSQIEVREPTDVLLRLGAEGGSLQLCRSAATSRAEHYVVRLSEMDYGLDEFGSVEKVIGEADSVADALVLMDRFPWFRLTVLEIAPEIEGVVLAGVEKRGGKETVARWVSRIASLRAGE